MGELPAAEGSAGGLSPAPDSAPADGGGETAGGHRELAGLLAKAGLLRRWLRILRPSVDWIDQDLSVDDFTAPAELLPV